MRCDRIQGLLKSDYLDGQATAKEKQAVLEHLKQCPQCRQMEKELLAARQVLQTAKEQQPPERLWQNIRQAIITERLNAQEVAHKSVWERLRDLIWAPRPVFAVASALTAAIFIAIFAGLIIQNRLSISRLDSALSVIEYRTNGETEQLMNGFGTNVEEYFL
jgi:predicted anti-sigma-YlaC factor YlaD